MSSASLLRAGSLVARLGHGLLGSNGTVSNQHLHQHRLSVWSTTSSQIPSSASTSSFDAINSEQGRRGFISISRLKPRDPDSTSSPWRTTPSRLKKYTSKNSIERIKARAAAKVEAETRAANAKKTEEEEAAEYERSRESKHQGKQLNNSTGILLILFT